MTFWDKLQANVGALLAGTSVAEEQARSDAADAALRHENDVDRPRLGDAWAEDTERNIVHGQEDVAVEIEAGFEEGWREGQDNISEFGRGVGRVAGDVAGSAAKGVAAGAWEFVKKNWWWIVPGCVGAFFWFGGMALLPRRKKA